MNILLWSNSMANKQAPMLPVQTRAFYTLELSRSANVEKYTEELLTVKCRSDLGTSLLTTEFCVSTFLSPPQTINWTLAASMTSCGITSRHRMIVILHSAL